MDAIERDHNDAAIFSDLEVGDLRPNKDRMKKEELFGAEINGHGGLILNKGTSTALLENQFIQLFNDPKMIESMRQVVVNANLERAIFALNLDRKSKNRELCLNLLNEAVYMPSITQDVFTYCDWLNETISMEVCPEALQGADRSDHSEGTWVDYDLKKHGYLPFGNAVGRGHSGIILDNEGECIAESQDCLRTKNKKPKSRILVKRNVDVRRGRAHAIHGFEFSSPDLDRPYVCKHWDRQLGETSTHLTVFDSPAMAFDGRNHSLPVAPTGSEMEPRINPGFSGSAK